MALPLALPLAPVVAPGASAAAATFVAGSSLALAKGVYGFRRETPTLPPLTGLEGVATLPELIADALAGARVPVALPPNPLGPRGSLAALAATAAAAGIWKILRNLPQQLWGLLNGPKRETGSVNPLAPTGEYVQQGTATNGEPLAVGTYRLGIFNGETGNFVPGYSNEFVSPNVVGYRVIPTMLSWRDEVRQPITNTFLGYRGYTNFWQTSAGEIQSGWQTLGSGYFDPDTYSLRIELVSNTSGGSIQQLNPPPVATPWNLPVGNLPGLTPAVLPALPAGPLPQPLPQPVPEPQEVARDEPIVPVSPTTVQTIGGQTSQTPRAPGVWPELLNPGGTRSPLPAETPALTPVTPFGPVALPNFPTTDPSRPTQQVNTAGQVEPLADPAPTTTSATATVPWPGAAPLDGKALAPPATLVGIAQEVGKIERKIEVMMNPNEPGNLIDRFGDVSDLLGPLIEALFAITDGTTYALDSPCEVDEEGNKLPPVTVQAPGALNGIGVLVNRIDALAQLLQVHKNLKQPSCKNAPPQGEVVTVNFEQIE